MRNPVSNEAGFFAFCLEFLAQKFDDYVSDEGAEKCDGKVCGRKDIDDCEAERLSRGVAGRELAHQQIRIKEEYDKRDFDECSTERVESMRWRGLRHSGMIPAKRMSPKRNRSLRERDRRDEATGGRA